MIGEKLGSFAIEKQLGVGAMGVVYKATNEKTGKPAAVKVISGELATKGNAAERFKREADILKQFSHPNIVRFLAVGRSKGKDYFAMEFITGGTLEDVLKKRELLDWKETLDLGIQLCDALHYAHEKGVIHRDLKPSNLMINEEGKLKLTDFGIAKDLEAEALTGTGRTLGTAAYMAPEQIRGTPAVSARTDLYSLGVVFYQMLTGHCPFQGKSAMILMHCHLTEAAPRVSSKLPDVPRALDDLIYELMMKDPTTRPWDAKTVADKLRQIKERGSKGKLAPVFDIPKNPARLGTAPTEPATAGTRAAVKEVADDLGVGGRKRRRRRDTSGEAVGTRDLKWVGTLLLLLALVGLVGFTGYMLFWPHSKAELLRRAGTAMSTNEIARWKEARELYFDEIERRFPDEKEQVRKWRDQIGVSDIGRRAGVLERPNLLAGNKPDGPAESLYVAAYTAADAAEKDGDLEGAIATWDDMVKSLETSTEDTDRYWAMHAAKKVEALRGRMESERSTVLKMLAEMEEKEKIGEPRQAASIRKDILKRYGKSKHLADLLEPISGSTPP